MLFLSLAISVTDKFGKWIGYVIPFDTLLGMWYLSMLGLKLIHVNDRDLRYLSPHSDLFSNLQGLITQHNTIINFNIGERVINDAHDYFLGSRFPRAMKLISFIWFISPLDIKIDIADLDYRSEWEGEHQYTTKVCRLCVTCRYS